MTEPLKQEPIFLRLDDQWPEWGIRYIGHAGHGSPELIRMDVSHKADRITRLRFAWALIKSALKP